MAIEFVCSNCRKTLRVPDEHLGKRARCPACQSINLIEPSASPGDSANLQSDQAGVAFTSSANVPEYGSEPKLNPYSATEYSTPRSQLAPHRGGLVLTLGIFAFLCNCFLLPGILAWVFGSSDLKQMRAGTMDRDGETLTTVGMVLGIISVVLPLLAVVFYVVFIVFVILAHVVA